MAQIVLIGLGAGAAAALLFASVASGSALAVLLFYLAPLPILLAVLGWSHWAGLLGAIVAALALGAVFSGFFFLAFLLGIGLPAWWLGYLLLLARPGENAGEIDWYPAGRVVLWTAILGALVVIAAIPQIGTDEESFRAALRAGFERIIRIQSRIPADGKLVIPGLSDPARLIDFLVLVVPPGAAVLSTVTSLINLWIAARIVRISGRLHRPWPDIAAITFPPFAPGLLALAVAGTFLGSMLGIVAGILTASLLIAYAALGFAVTHSITRGMDSRPFVLAGVYAAVFVFGWPVLVMTVLGLADAAFDIRGRVAAKRGPPTINT